MTATEFNDKVNEVINDAIDGGNDYDEIIRWLADVIDEVREESGR